MKLIRVSPRPALALSLIAATVLAGVISMKPAQANEERPPSRLSKLLLRRASMSLPTRLVLGAENRFVVKAQPGSVVRLLMSAEGEGFILPNGTPLRVGEEVQQLGGVVPENGVLELVVDMPNEPDLDGKVIYVEGLAGPSEDELFPVELIDPTGRRTDYNTLVIAKPADRTGPPLMPAMPGVNPQMIQQITTMSEIMTNKDDSRRQLLDDGGINRNRQMDQNPFTIRGTQPGLR